MMRRFLPFLAFAILASPASGQTPEDTVKSISTQIDKGTLDLAVPESPAFTALGLSPTTVTRPATGTQLATSLLNGVDEKGHLQNGVAVDVAPVFLLAGRKIDINTYRKNYLAQLAARFQTSVATTKGDSPTDSSARLAVGFRVTLFDLGDPRTDDQFMADLTKAAEDALKAAPPVPPGASDADVAKWKAGILAAMAPLTKGIRDAQTKRAWNRSAIAIGAAPTWLSSDGSLANLEGSGGALWVSGAYGFEHVQGLSETSQLLFQYRRLFNSAIAATSTTAAYKQDSSLWGVQFKAGTATTNALIEAAHLSTSPDSVAPAETYSRIAAGFDQRIADGIWLHVAVGGEGGHFGGKNQTFVLSEFKWGWTSK